MKNGEDHNVLFYSNMIVLLLLSTNPSLCGIHRSIWEGTLWLPRETTISFRFFIGKMMDPPETDKEHSPTRIMEVILWETNIQPRRTFVPGPSIQ